MIDRTHMLSIPWRCTNGSYGLISLDVRTLGFLSVAEFKSDPEYYRFVDDLVDRAMRKATKK